MVPDIFQEKFASVDRQGVRKGSSRITGFGLLSSWVDHRPRGGKKEVFMFLQILQPRTFILGTKKLPWPFFKIGVQKWRGGGMFLQNLQPRTFILGVQKW